VECGGGARTNASRALYVVPFATEMVSDFKPVARDIVEQMEMSRGSTQEG